MMLTVYFIEWIGSFTSILLMCEIAGRVSNKFEQINDIIVRFQWYLFPIKMRQSLPIILVNVQKPVVFKCTANVPCNRETFARVSCVDAETKNSWNKKLSIANHIEGRKFSSNSLQVAKGEYSYFAMLCKTRKWNCLNFTRPTFERSIQTSAGDSVLF